MDERIKSLVDELGLAIKDAISASDEVSEVATQIQESGYEVLLFLDATVAVVKREERPVSWRARTSSRLESGFNREDIDFLKLMHISADR